MARLGSGTAFVAAISMVALGAGARAAPAEHAGATHAHAAHHHHHHHVVRRHADQAGFAGDRHHAHSVPTHAAGGQGLGIDTTPDITTPYPFDGHLAGDGILRTGILDSNVLRAFGVVPN